MHAAAERERRLAAAAAVARQQLDLGLSDVAVLAGACNEQKLQPAAQEQLQQMAKLTREVVEQNQLLQQAMKQQQAQLSEHQVSWLALYYFVAQLMVALRAAVSCCHFCDDVTSLQACEIAACPLVLSLCRAF